jgi:hypothetical protein
MDLLLGCLRARCEYVKAYEMELKPEHRDRVQENQQALGDHASLVTRQLQQEGFTDEEVSVAWAMLKESMPDSYFCDVKTIRLEEMKEQLPWK